MRKLEKLTNLNKYKNEALSCVFCGECRNPIWPNKGVYGVCPIYQTDFTPKFEPFFSRGKNVILKGLLWGELSLSKEVSEIFYQCTTCGACQEFCHNSLLRVFSYAVLSYI